MRKNYKTEMKKKELNKWKGIPCSCRKTEYCQDILSSSLMFRFDTVLTSYFIDIDKLILNCVWRGKRPRVANEILKNKGVEIFCAYSPLSIPTPEPLSTTDLFTLTIVLPFQNAIELETLCSLLRLAFFTY